MYLNGIGGDKMKFKTAIEQVRRYKYYVTYNEIGEALSLSLPAVKKRISRDSDLKYDETFMLAKYFSLPVRLFFHAADVPHTIPVEYWDGARIRLERNPNMEKYYMDFEIAYKYNKNFDKNDFRIICMRGDKLNGGMLWCKDNDVLLLDVTKTDISKPGLYAYQCEDGNYVAMAWIEQVPEGVLFKYTNSEYKDELRTPEFLTDVKFKVIGRIIKNLMFFA